jgi:hypothetical protein
MAKQWRGSNPYHGLELLTGTQAELTTDVVQAKLDDIAKRRQDWAQKCALDEIPLGTGKVAEKVAALPGPAARCLTRW